MIKMKHRYLWIWVFILVLTACKISKDSPVPTSAVPQGFRDVETKDSSSIGDIKWSTFFTEPALKSLIDSAIVRNYDMQIAVKNIGIAEQLLKQAKVTWLPAFSLNVTGSTNVPSKNSLNGSLTNQFLGTNHIEDFSANTGMSWEIDVWRKIRNQKKAALLSYLQSTEARNVVQTNLVSNVSQSFYNLLMLDAQLKIAEKNLALNDSTLQMIRMQQQSGQVTLLAVQQAEAQQLVSAQLIPQLQQQIAIQENVLSVLTGTLPGAITRNVTLENILMPDALPAGVPAGMVSRRPDVKSEELALAIANAKVGIAKAGLYPTFSITAAGGLNAFKAHTWFEVPASLFGTAAGGITQPIFQHRLMKTQFETAKLEREKSVLRFRQSVLNAVGEVSNALVRIEKLEQQQQIAAARVNTLQAATRNADLLFKSGMASYIEVITAQGNALRSELELVALKRDRLGAAVELYRSLGGGWK